MQRLKTGQRSGSIREDGVERMSEPEDGERAAYYHLLELMWLFALMDSQQPCLPAHDQVNQLSSTDEGRARKGSPTLEGNIGSRCLLGKVDCL